MARIDELNELVRVGDWPAFEKFFCENLAELVEDAIGIAYANGAVATIVAKVIREKANVELVAKTYNHFNNGFTLPNGLPKYPAGNVAFGEVAIAIGSKALEVALAQPDLSRMRREGAPLFTNLAGWYAIVGQRAEAVTVARQAVAFFTECAASNDPTEIASLAGALDMLLATLRPLGLGPEADDAGRKAIELYRRLARSDPGIYGSHLARSLVNWAGGLRDGGDVDVRLASYREAVDLYRAAGAVGERNFDPELCQTLIGFASVLEGAGILDEALNVASDAREIAEKLMDRHGESFGQLLVMAKTNLALAYQRRGELETAVLHFDAVVGAARHLYQATPAAFTELFARCLSMSALALVETKDLEAAFENLDECLRVCADPGRINDHVFLASTYTNFAILAWETRHPKRVMEGITRARSELGPLSAIYPNRFDGSYETLRQLEQKLISDGDAD